MKDYIYPICLVFFCFGVFLIGLALLDDVLDNKKTLDTAYKYTNKRMDTIMPSCIKGRK